MVSQSLVIMWIYIEVRQMTKVCGKRYFDNFCESYRGGGGVFVIFSQLPKMMRFGDEGCQLGLLLII